MAGSRFLVLAPSAEKMVWNAMILAVWLQVGFWIHGGIQAWRLVRDAQAKTASGGQSAGNKAVDVFAHWQTADSDPMSSGLGMIKDDATGGKPQYAPRLQAQLQF